MRRFGPWAPTFNTVRTGNFPGNDGAESLHADRSPGQGHRSPGAPHRPEMMTLDQGDTQIGNRGRTHHAWTPTREPGSTEVWPAGPPGGVVGIGNCLLNPATSTGIHLTPDSFLPATLQKASIELKILTGRTKTAPKQDDACKQFVYSYLWRFFAHEE